MTQAINLANFANSLDTSGGVPPSQLNAPVTIAKGGTNAATATNARTNLDVPQTNGTGATGNWPIDISGTSTSLTTTNFSVLESGGNLIIKYGATTIVSISSTGTITAG